MQNLILILPGELSWWKYVGKSMNSVWKIRHFIKCFFEFGRLQAWKSKRIRKWHRIWSRSGGKFEIEIFFKKLSSFLEFLGLMDWHIFEIYKKKEINLFKFRYNQKSTRIKLNSALNIITRFFLKFEVQFLLSAPPIGIYSAFSAICS